MKTYIEIEGARENNLKNVSLKLPHYALTVVTGISGSGKSSLAYDTLYKEGQRRFIESLSPYARQFLGQMEKPKVEHIEGLSPAICIDQKRRGLGSRSTVGTITEIYDHLRLLFARLGTPYCPECNVKIVSQTLDQIVSIILERYQGKQVFVLAPMVIERKGEYRKELEGWKRDGFVRVRIDGEIRRLDEEIKMARYEKHSIELVLDRLTIDDSQKMRLSDDIDQASMISEGMVGIGAEPEGYEVFSLHRSCPKCGLSVPEIEPRLFSFNNDQGACSHCQGRGTYAQFDLELLVPDPSRSIADQALACIKKDGFLLFSSSGMKEIGDLARFFKISLDTPWNELPEFFRQAVLQGTQSVPEKSFPKVRGKKKEVPPFEGVLPILQDLYDKWNLFQVRRFMQVSRCPVCHGSRLRKESLHVLFRDQNISQLSCMTAAELSAFLASVELSDYEKTVGKEIFKQLHYRLSFLLDVGIPYLTLDRPANTLAGGEMQRIRLARQLGSGLQGVLYILDEPSIGLHPRDNLHLLKAVCGLRDAGNTLVVIEHDEETMRAADHIVDVGPGAGNEGGKIVFEGDMRSLCRDNCLTGLYLQGKETIPIPPKRRKPSKERLTIVGAKEFNLKDITVEIPLGLLVVVTGVSGSGKSTLVDHILYNALAAHFEKHEDIPGKHEAIRGIEWIDKVVAVDQSPIGRSSRSNPATYTKVFDEIRDLFAMLPESKTRGYLPGRFSFNVKGGRCPHCEGDGYKEVEMQFLANVLIPCETCDGKRFNRETLEIKYKGKSISDVLDMTVSEACKFLENHPKIHKILQTLVDVGMGYVRLGQPSPTLSGGEAQRIKLVRELRKKDTGKTLYILDEPTTGLHFADIKKLLYALNRLVDHGNTVLVIEHNLDIIKTADWIIDLGPEGGEAGGKLVAQGHPEKVMRCKSSYTGNALKDYLAHTHSSHPGATVRKGVEDRKIVIHGANKHNLKNVTVSIPKEKMTVVTGVSGSGKSSLVFDTLFAEGQKAFLESLSTYARRFLGRLSHGDVDAIEGLAPAIAIDQKSVSKNPRSTVATMTEIYDYLRILYARAGIPHCPTCGERLVSYSPSTAAQSLLDRFGKSPSRREGKKDTAGLLLAPLYMPGARKIFRLTSAGELREYASHLQSQGFTRLLIGGKVFRLDNLPEELGQRVPVHLVVDRVILRESNLSRIAEGLETAFSMGNEVAFFYDEVKSLVPFCTHPACVSCDHYQTEELHPRMFSFNHYLGACPVCDGLGYSSRFLDDICPECQGDRLRKPYLAVKVGGLSITQLCQRKINEAFAFLRNLNLDKNQALIAKDLLREICNRLSFLMDVGLSYLTLDRRGDTLAGGEAQRIRLATQIGNQLVGVLYVLDEPTIGLHQRDTEMLLGTLRKLVDLGNTVVMVEHDAQCMQNADHLIELGPGAGVSGGKIVYEGDLEGIKRQGSLTGRYLSGTLSVGTPWKEPPASFYLTVHNACLHNLKGITVSFPCERFTVVTGVSGSGKSTLVVDILQNALGARQKETRDERKLIKGGERDGFGKITGFNHFDKLVVIDQSPLARSITSNPATYCNVFTDIREFFASLPGAKARGFGISRFSTNRPGGRCEACEGRGFIQVEMHFLSDVFIQCDACKGQRFLSETLSVHYKGKNISQVLDMDISQSAEFFSTHPKIGRKLKVLEEIGLGYLTLGQPTSTLSGGEAQRLKLAVELALTNSTNTLYLMDEPTTGLHAADIQKLLEVVRRLVNKGNTVIMIEHNLDVVRAGDWIVDLGPEGGEEGGNIVCAGDQQTVMACERSHTGKSLKMQDFSYRCSCE